MRKSTLISALLFFSAVGPASAAVVAEPVEYKQGETILEGYVAYDDATEAKRPGVIVVHDWMGQNEYAQKRARQLAEMGYVAFSADIYGKGVRPKNSEEAGKQAGIYKNDRKLLRERAKAAYDVLRMHPLVDEKRLAAIGFCFGGMTALEMGRDGLDLKGIVSFHGTLNTPDPSLAKNIKGKVLVLHGGSDPFVKKEEVDAFEKEMKDAGVDSRVVVYPDAVHAFTVPQAGDDPSTGAAYNSDAAKKSWAEMEGFFDEVLAAE